MVGRRQIIFNGDAYNLRRRDSDYSRHWWIGCNLTFLFRVDEDNFLIFRSVERQVVGPCPRLYVVKLDGLRVSVHDRDDEIRIIGKLPDNSRLKIACIDHVRRRSNARSLDDASSDGLHH